VGLAGLGSLLGYHVWKLHRASAESPAIITDAGETLEHTDHQSNPALETVPPTVVEPGDADSAEAVVVPAVEQPDLRAAIARAAQDGKAEATPYTRQLVANLTQLELASGGLTAEQAEQWKAGLRVLVQQGSSAVPAIGEFLEQNLDGDVGAGSLLGYPSIRAGLLDALQQINGPEAQALMLQTLQTTSIPAEIARLARYLEQEGPGQFREDITTAVRETLAQAAAGQLRGWYVGPLFQVLESYGDANVVADLEKSTAKWNYYSALALANLPSGEGIPSLIRLAQEAPSSTTRGVALEALSQVAVQYPQASAALVELARAGKLSERNWIAAAAALGGERYFIRDTGGDNPPVPEGSGVKSYHLESSNQNFYSAPAWGGMSIEQINQRLAIIDQLLAVSSSATVTQALEKARASLATKDQQASAN